MKQLIQFPLAPNHHNNLPGQQLLQEKDGKDRTVETPPKQAEEQEAWPEDDIAEKYIKSGGKAETPSKEDEEEEEQQLRESREPKK